MGDYGQIWITQQTVKIIIAKKNQEAPFYESDKYQNYIYILHIFYNV